VKNESAYIGSKTGLVGAIDSDDKRLTGFVSQLNLNRVVIATPHPPHHRIQTENDDFNNVSDERDRKDSM